MTGPRSRFTSDKAAAAIADVSAAVEAAKLFWLAALRAAAAAAAAAAAELAAAADDDVDDETRLYGRVVAMPNFLTLSYKVRDGTLNLRDACKALIPLLTASMAAVMSLFVYCL